VLGLGVYLFHEVRLTPAQASATPTAKKDDKPPEKSDKADKAEAPAVETPEAKVRLPIHRHDPSVKPEPEVAPAADPNVKANPKLDSLMDEANHAYDHGELDEARTLALKVLETTPTSARMLRVMVSAWCTDGDAVEAQKYYAQLPVSDRGQMRTRCERSGVTFTDVPPPPK